MLKGVSVKMQGTTWIVPAFSKEESRDAAKKLNSLAHDPDQQYEVLLDCILKALRRNYPKLTRDEVEESMTHTNYKAMVHAVFGHWPC